jgi:hypothetical protein
MSMRTSIKKNRGLLAATSVALITLFSIPSLAVTGTAVFCSSVSAHSYHTYRDVFLFRAHQPRTVVVEGDHDTDLDCWLYDEYGNIVDSDTDNTDICILEVTPRWTGEFSLQVANRGHVYNNYCVGTR